MDRDTPVKSRNKNQDNNRPVKSRNKNRDNDGDKNAKNNEDNDDIPVINMISIHQISMKKNGKPFPRWNKLCDKEDHYFTLWEPEDIEEELQLAFGPEALEKYTTLNRSIRRNIAVCLIPYVNGGLGVNRDLDEKYDVLKSPCMEVDGEKILYYHCEEGDESTKELLLDMLK